MKCFQVILKVIFCTFFLYLASCKKIEIETEHQIQAEVVNADMEFEQFEDTVELEESIQKSNIVRARIIADILYEAKYAFDDNKLMLPLGDNAFDRYQEVLSYEPENQVALEGLKEIFIRYLELADEAMGRGEYANAEEMIDRAYRIDAESDEVLNSLLRLEQARKVSVDVYTLEPDLLSQQSVEILVHLSEIAELVKKAGATFLITARTDEEGRWIYKTMRDSLGGYRLRGNITLGTEPSVRINSSQI